MLAGPRVPDHLLTLYSITQLQLGTGEAEEGREVVGAGESRGARSSLVYRRWETLGCGREEGGSGWDGRVNSHQALWEIFGAWEQKMAGRSHARAWRELGPS